FVSWLLMVVFGQVGLQHRLILIHASVIAYQQKQGIAFLGKSGTGKSTHSKLWLQHIPDTELLNDDNPVVRLEEDGKAMIYGTPRSEEHTSELQSRENLVCRLLLEKK